MRPSRRDLLLASLGAAQLGLLDRFSLLGRGKAWAQSVVDRPTKLLTIYIPGGIHHEFVWAQFPDDRLARFMPPAAMMPGVFYDRQDVKNLDGSGDAQADEPIRRLRSHITWNPANPADRSIGEPNNKGYAWAEPNYKLFENVALILGVDQGTAAHESGVVASMCGIAGANYVVPSIPARIANHFLSAFPDRPVPNVTVMGAPRAPAVTLPAGVDASTVASIQDLQFAFSDKRPNWNGLRDRRSVPAFAFDGTPTGQAELTVVEEAVLKAVRGRRGRVNAATDGAMGTLYDTYAGVSKTIARNIVDTLENTVGVEKLPLDIPWCPGRGRFGWQIGYADFYATDSLWANEFDLALRFLKSDLATSVTFRMTPTFGFDSHFSNPYPGHSTHLRGCMESIGRFLIEMKLTPSKSRPDRSLLDETLVYITSEFGRSAPISGGSDHNPTHTAVLANGLIQGNRMIGGIADNGLGAPMSITEESGEKSMRAPAARDVAATISAVMGLSTAEAFMPGGYGVPDGILR